MKNFYFFLIVIISVSCNNKIESNVIINLDKEKTAIKNGVLYYNQKPFSGQVNYFDQLNKTSCSSIYLNGLKNGKEIKFYDNASLAEERFYKKGLKVAIHNGWFKNGNLKFEYHFNNLGQYDGTVKEWYLNKKLFKYFNFKDGKEIGNQRLWQNDGKIRANYVVKNGDRFGLIGLKKCYSVTTNKNEI